MLNKISVLHSHSVGELFKCLAVEGDGHTRICVKGELHTVLNLWFFTVLHRCVRVIFIPAVRRFDNTSSTQRKLLLVLSLGFVLFCCLPLPDQTQRILPNVDQTPQGFHRLVGCRRHIWKLLKS